MRLAKTIVALALLLAVAGSAQAQWMKPIEIYLGIGTSSPSSPDEFEQFFKGSYSLSVGAGMRTSSFMEIVGRFEYNRFPSDAEDFEGGLITAKTIGAEAKLNASLSGSPLEPYLLLGMGVSWLRQTEWEPHLPTLLFSGQTDIFYTGGVGVQTQLDGPLGFFAQAKLTGITTSFPNKDFGGSLRYWSFGAGIKLIEKL